MQPEINCFSSLQLLCIPSFTLGLSQGYHDSRRQSKVLGLLTAKSIAKLLGPRFCAAWADLTGEHKHRVS